MKELLFFSHNDYKIKEINFLFKNLNVKLLSLNDFPKIKEPEENGGTFEENAKIKALCGFKKFKTACFADDSGICIEALNFKPGIFSSRFQKECGGIEKAFELIIDTVKSKKNKNAFFKTSISLIINNKNIHYFEGVVKGKISLKPKGDFGFHYDPIFIPNGFKKTFGEMSPEQKNSISHRSIAFEKLKKFILS